MPQKDEPSLLPTPSYNAALLQVSIEKLYILNVACVTAYLLGSAEGALLIEAHCETIITCSINLIMRSVPSCTFRLQDQGIMGAPIAGVVLQDMLANVQQNALQDALKGHPNLAKAIILLKVSHAVAAI